MSKIQSFIHAIKTAAYKLVSGKLNKHAPVDLKTSIRGG